MASTSKKSGKSRSTGKTALPLWSTPELGGIIDNLSSTSISAISSDSSSYRRVVGARKSPGIGRSRKRRFTNDQSKKQGTGLGKKRSKLSSKARDIEDDWETESEETITGEVGVHTPSPSKIISTPESVCLFRDLDSPDRMREGPARLPQSDLESPLFRPHRATTSADKSIIERQDEQLPLPSQPSLNLVDFSSDESEEDLSIRKGDINKQYKGPGRKVVHSSPKMPVPKGLFKIRHSNAAANLLWDKLIGEKYGDRSRGLESSTESAEEGSGSSSPPLGVGDENANYDRSNAVEYLKNLQKKTKRPVEMAVASGRLTKSHGEVVSSDELLYTVSVGMDGEAEIGGKHGGRMTLDEWRRKRRQKRKAQRIKQQLLGSNKQLYTV